MAVRCCEDAEWMSGKSRNLPAIGLTKKGFLMDVEIGRAFR
jgi:hypothetical protein